MLDTRATDGGEIAITGRSLSILEGSQILAGVAAGYRVLGAVKQETLHFMRLEGYQFMGEVSIRNTVAAATVSLPSMPSGMQAIFEFRLTLFQSAMVRS